jgi:hypothetical protein
MRRIYLTDIIWDFNEVGFNAINNRVCGTRPTGLVTLLLSLCVPVHYQHAPTADTNVPAAGKLWHVPRFATGRQDCQHLSSKLPETVKVLRYLSLLLDTGFVHVGYEDVTAVADYNAV